MSNLQKCISVACLSLPGGSCVIVKDYSRQVVARYHLRTTIRHADTGLYIHILLNPLRDIISRLRDGNDAALGLIHMLRSNADSGADLSFDLALPLPPRSLYWHIG